MKLKNGRNFSLFAKKICRYPVENFMSFYCYASSFIVCINCMVAAFTLKMPAVFLKVSDYVPSLN